MTEQTKQNRQEEVKEYELVNLTPHTINVVKDNEVVKFEPSGVIARLKTTAKLKRYVNSMGKKFEVYETNFGEIELSDTIDLEGKVVLVGMVFQGNAEKFIDGYGAEMVLAPDTSPDSVIRDHNGRITAVRRFTLLAEKK